MARSDTDLNDFLAKAASDDPAYKVRVAEPVMTAVDNMPRVWRDLVHEFGYVDVYRAWKGGRSPQDVRDKANANGGLFELKGRIP